MPYIPCPAAISRTFEGLASAAPLSPAINSAAGIVSGAMERAKFNHTSSCALVWSPVSPAVPPLRTASASAAKFFRLHGLARKLIIEARQAGEWRFKKVAASSVSEYWLFVFVRNSFTVKNSHAALRRPGFTSQRFGGVRAFRNGREDVQLNRRFQRLGFLKRDHGIENAFRAWLGFRCGCGHELSLLLLKVD